MRTLTRFSARHKQARRQACERVQLDALTNNRPISHNKTPQNPPRSADGLWPPAQTSKHIHSFPLSFCCISCHDRTIRNACSWTLRARGGSERSELATRARVELQAEPVGASTDHDETEPVEVEGQPARVKSQEWRPICDAAITGSAFKTRSVRRLRRLIGTVIPLLILGHSMSCLVEHGSVGVSNRSGEHIG